jgi:hypothetical protein
MHSKLLAPSLRKVCPAWSRRKVVKCVSSGSVTPGFPATFLADGPLVRPGRRTQGFYSQVVASLSFFLGWNNCTWTQYSCGRGLSLRPVSVFDFFHACCAQTRVRRVQNSMSNPVHVLLLQHDLF